MAATEELGLEVFVEGWRKFEGILDKLDRKIDSTGGSMAKTGSIAGGAFAVALGNVAFKAVTMLADGLIQAGRAAIGFGVDSLRMAADFQGQMAILEIAASSTGLSFDQLHDAALQVGGDTRLLGVSATGAADSMTGLFKAGLSNVEVFGDLEGYMAGTAELGGALRASIDLAAASELDMVQASDLAAIALAAFGGEMETETERADFINEAMNNMVKAADASVAEVSGLAEALKMVGPTASAAGLSIQDTNNALAILSTRGIQGSMAGTALDGMLRSLRDVTPKAAEALGDLGIEIFDVEGEMHPLVDIVGQFETALGGATEAEKAAAIGAIFTAQGQRAMNTLMAEGVEGWNSMAEATDAAAGIQEQAAARGETFNAQMESLEGTVETLKIGIGEQFLPVATELVSWFAEMVDQHGPELQAIFEGVAVVVTDVTRFLMGLLDTGDPLNDFFVQLPEPIKAFVMFMQNDFMPAIREVWDFVMEQVAVVVAWFQENMPLIQETGQTLAEFWQYVIVPALDNAWNIIKEIVGVAMNSILETITLVMQLITGDWEGAWQTIQGMALSRWEAIQSIVTEFIEGVANAVGTTTDEIVATWKNNWEMAKLIVTQTWENIKTTVIDSLIAIVGAVKEKIESIVATLRGFVSAFRSAGSNLINALKSGIMSAAQGVVNAARKVVQDAIDAARHALGERSPSRVGIELGENFDRGVALGLAKLAPMVQAQIQAVVQAPAAIGGGNTYSAETTNQYNLTTQSTTRPGALAMEFGAMQFAGAGASR